VCGVLDADAGTLQLLHRKAAELAGVSAVSANIARWHWQADCHQDQVPWLQVHEDQ